MSIPHFSPTTCLPSLLPYPSTLPLKMSSPLALTLLSPTLTPNQAVCPLEPCLPPTSALSKEECPLTSWRSKILEAKSQWDTTCLELERATRRTVLEWKRKQLLTAQKDLIMSTGL